MVIFLSLQFESTFSCNTQQTLLFLSAAHEMVLASCAGFRSLSIFETEGFVYFAICNIYLAAKNFKASCAIQL